MEENGLRLMAEKVRKMEKVGGPCLMRYLYHGAGQVLGTGLALFRAFIARSTPQMRSQIPNRYQPWRYTSAEAPIQFATG